MNLKFRCSNCSEDIIVKFLKAGEIAKCRNCGAETVVSATASETDEEPNYSSQQSENQLRSEEETIQRPRINKGIILILILVGFIIGLIGPTISILLYSYLITKYHHLSIIAMLMICIAWMVLFRHRPDYVKQRNTINSVIFVIILIFLYLLIFESIAILLNNEYISGRMNILLTIIVATAYFLINRSNKFLKPLNIYAYIGMIIGFTLFFILFMLIILPLARAWQGFMEGMRYR